MYGLRHSEIFAIVVYVHLLDKTVSGEELMEVGLRTMWCLSRVLISVRRVGSYRTGGPAGRGSHRDASFDEFAEVFLLLAVSLQDADVGRVYLPIESPEVTSGEAAARVSGIALPLL